MKDRRKFIDENRDLFDDQEPSLGHTERFEAMLEKHAGSEKKGKSIKRAKLIGFISIAASIAILIGVAVKFNAPDGMGTVQQEETDGTEIMITEFQTTNEYYNQQMEEQISDIMCKLANTDTENQAQLSEDLQKIIEDNTVFVDEMAKSENKEIAIKYLVKHYRTNIQALEDINEKLGKYTKC